MQITELFDHFHTFCCKFLNVFWSAPLRYKRCMFSLPITVYEDPKLQHFPLRTDYSVTQIYRWEGGSDICSAACRFHKMRKISWPAESRLTSQEGLCCVEWVSDWVSNNQTQKCLIFIFSELFSCRTIKEALYALQYTVLVRYFGENDWLFHDTNVRTHQGQLTPEECDIFYFNISQLNWASYLESCVKGVRQFIIKDHLSTLPQARTRYKV
jgi:hypothetical protein